MRGETCSKGLVENYDKIIELYREGLERTVTLYMLSHDVEKKLEELKREIDKTGIPKQVKEKFTSLYKLLTSDYLQLLRTGEMSGKSNLLEVIDQVLFDLEILYTTNDIQLVKLYQNYREEILVPINRYTLLYILTELLVNSIKTLEKKEEEKTIIVDVKKEGKHIQVIIGDNGKFTVNPEHTIKPFITTDTNSIGLGLYIVKEILGTHKGNLEIRVGENLSYKGYKLNTIITVSIPV